MDEQDFWDKTEELFKKYLKPVLAFIETQQVIKDVGLADLSKKEPRKTSNKFSVEYEGENYFYTKSDKSLCKYCNNHYSAWKQPYKQGDRPVAVSLEGNLLGPKCPKYA